MRIVLTLDVAVRSDMPALTENQLAHLILRDKHHGIGSIMAGFLPGEDFTHATELVIEQTLVEILP